MSAYQHDKKQVPIEGELIKAGTTTASRKQQEQEHAPQTKDNRSRISDMHCRSSQRKSDETIHHHTTSGPPVEVNGRTTVIYSTQEP